MLPRYRPSLLAVIALSLLLSAPAEAQPAEAQGEAIDLDRDSLTVGVGLGFQPSYEGSDDRVLVVVPGIQGRVSRINFTLRGNRFSADLVPDKAGPGWDYKLGPVIDLNLNRTLRIVDPQVTALGHHDGAVALGAVAGIARTGVLTSDYDKLGVSLTYLHDISGVHKSYVVTPAIAYSTPLSRKAFVSLDLSADYMGTGYAVTYFSVDPAGSAASGLPIYSANAGWKDWTISGFGAVALTGDLTRGFKLVGTIGYRRLVNDAAASPVTSIAGSPNQLSGILGLAYTF